MIGTKTLPDEKSLLGEASFVLDIYFVFLWYHQDYPSLYPYFPNVEEL